MVSRVLLEAYGILQSGWLTRRVNLDVGLMNDEELSPAKAQTVVTNILMSDWIDKPIFVTTLLTVRPMRAHDRGGSHRRFTTLPIQVAYGR